jgi:hypothetical protein
MDFFIQRHRNASLRGTAPPRVIDKQSAHELGCHGKELRPVLPVFGILFHQTEESFVY